MKRGLVIVFRLVPLLVLTGCVTYQKHDRPIFPEAREDKGLLYFYRDDVISDSSSECYITRDDLIVGRLFARSYTFIFSEPGSFLFRAQRGPGIGYRIPVEGGRTYYFRVELKPIWGGVMGYGLDLIPVPEEEAMSKMRDLTYVSMERKK